MNGRLGWALLLVTALTAPASRGAAPPETVTATGSFAELLEWAGGRGSSAVVVSQGGRIVGERRWDRPGSRAATTSDGWPMEDVASVQKSITAVLVAVAGERGHVRQDDAISRWLGAGWSRAPTEIEAGITVRHLLTMTSGLTDDLTSEASPGARWRYNTPAYGRLLAVLAQASGQSLESLTQSWLTGPLGMKDSRWERRSGPSAAVNPWGFLTTAHDLVRFGRMVLEGGRPVLAEGTSLDALLRPSQDLNPDYGCLWWLNGRGKPGRPGRRIPDAPDDLVAAEGARDCKLYVLPALDLVIVRLGEPAGRGFVEQFWQRFSRGGVRP